MSTRSLVSQENIPLTKAAQSVADYTAVKSITLAFFNSDGSEQYKSTQLRSSAASFGNFSLTLPYGSYKMIVIAHEGDFPITLSGLSEANFGGEKPKDTFLYSQDLVIENSTPVNLSATLSRIITRLIVISTDPKPENVKDVRHST